ncbi:MAG: inorganic phosphate transporter [Nitrospirota bacterium]|nr:inorganic phosphate transporter [Nitrospirota bacterium]
MSILNVKTLEKATLANRDELFRLGTALLFIVGIMLFTIVQGKGGTNSVLLVVAAMVGGYMAMNIGANDVANNVGPAVGSHSLTLVGAIIIAVIFETSGALIAGGDVVRTIKGGIIDPTLLPDNETFIWLMIGALLAGALWLNFATAIGAPVSTTHSIVGGVLGAGIAAGGWGIANWSEVSRIVASWVISPVLGGMIAAGFLYVIKHTITYKPSVLAAARRVVPRLVGLMAWAFVTYLMLKGMRKIIHVSFLTAMLSGGIAAVLIGYFLVKPYVNRMAQRLSDTKESVNKLFTIPLIFAAALLSFAHGANDVANAVSPLAGIHDAIISGGLHSEAPIPMWVMLVGAIGIALGLALYGPKLIHTVGSQITELDQTRAFCISMAAAITVIIASQPGLPVSSTHIAVGGVFGVGFLREYIKVNYSRMIEEIKLHHSNDSPEEVEAFLMRFEATTVPERSKMLLELKAQKGEGLLHKTERKNLRKIHRIELVKRTLLMRIAAAWLITVPVTAMIAAGLFFMIRGIMLP